MKPMKFDKRQEKQLIRQHTEQSKKAVIESVPFDLEKILNNKDIWKKIKKGDENDGK